jgi:pyruvate/2-oxoglutarate dehydrogenase complex dihydrolipoamide acyltransferase (E2) component
MALLLEIKVPLLSVNDITLTVTELSFKTGQQIKKGDVIMVFETSKTTYDVEAETNGFIQYLCDVDHDYEVDTIIARIFSDASDIQEFVAAPKAISEEEKLPFSNQPEWNGEPIFSSKALAMMQTLGIDKNVFKGKDFVNTTDVEHVVKGNGVKSVRKSPASKAATIADEHPLPVPDDVVLEKLSKNKKREIAYLSEVQSSGLISMVNATVQVDGIFSMLNPSLKYLKDSLLPIVIYETSRLLKKYPLLNSYFNNDSIAIYKNVNVGFAVDLGKGLKVLQIPATEKKDLKEIEQSIMGLSNKYLDDELAIEDLSNITFTITDLSAEGISSFLPLVNARNSAILGISSVDAKLNRATLTLTFDHRVTEGKTAAQFLGDLKERLESFRAKNRKALASGLTCYKCGKSLSNDLSDVGFVKCITPEGEEAHICQTCFKGF